MFRRIGWAALVLALIALGCSGTVGELPLSDGGAGVGAIDAGAKDAGSVDAGIVDSGQPDAGTDDAGRPDAGAADAGHGQDSGVLDSGVDDAGTDDAGVPDAGTTTSCWPFNQPSTQTLRASAKKVFAHYFSPYPISLDNKDPALDYYAKNYLQPDGESGKWAFCGGLLRDRPLPQTPWASGVDWEEKNMETEVHRAIQIGLDGFTFDVLSLTAGGQHRTRMEKLLDAAHAVDPEFVILLVPDMTAGAFGGGGGTDSDALAGLQTLLSAEGAKPAVMKLADGRIVLSPFAAEKRTAAFWSNALSVLADAGYPVALVPMPVGSWSSNASKFSGVTLYGASSWGTRTVSGAASLQTAPQLPHSNGLVWMGPIGPQDSRPKNLQFTEANNSAAYRAQWDATIAGGADWVQLITWNDYSEDTEVAPSAMTHTAFFDLSAYYTTWFKLGAQPPIVRDALYAFYRAHSMDPAVAPPDLTKQESAMVGKNGPATSTDEIELVGFLTAPGTLEIAIGGQTHTLDVSAGIQRFTLPLEEGTPTFKLVRGGTTVISLTGSTAINNTIVYQDPLYHADAKPTCVPYGQ